MHAVRSSPGHIKRRQKGHSSPAVRLVDVSFLDSCIKDFGVCAYLGIYIFLAPLHYWRATAGCLHAAHLNSSSIPPEMSRTSHAAGLYILDHLFVFFFEVLFQ